MLILTATRPPHSHRRRKYRTKTRPHGIYGSSGTPRPLIGAARPPPACLPASHLPHHEHTESRHVPFAQKKPPFAQGSPPLPKPQPAPRPICAIAALSILRRPIVRCAAILSTSPAVSVRSEGLHGARVLEARATELGWETGYNRDCVARELCRGPAPSGPAQGPLTRP